MSERNTHFFEAPDACDDPCLWENRPDDDPRCILSKYDLEDEYRDRLWPLIVAAVVSAA